MKSKAVPLLPQTKKSLSVTGSTSKIGMKLLDTVKIIDYRVLTVKPAGCRLSLFCDNVTV